MKKIKQIIWLDPITNANLSLLYVKSGAHAKMAFNMFITRILSVVSEEEEIVAKVLERIYEEDSKLKEYSMLIGVREVVKEVTKKVFACPICLAQFSSISELMKHLRTNTKCKEELAQVLTS